MGDNLDEPMAMVATPPNEAIAHQPSYATWLPRDIRYSDAFENSVQHTFESTPAGREGIVILPNDSPLAPEPGVSVRARDIDPGQLPSISLDQLPLPLDDPRRMYASPIPGIKLTHPGGYLEGGPGFAPDDDDAFARDFIAQFDIADPAQLRDVQTREIQQHIEEARKRMRARQEALQHNARIEKEIKTLTDQREMELKIETRMRDEAQTRRERREKRRTKNTG